MHPGVPRPLDIPRLFARISFSPELEARALERIAADDLAGSRRALLRLVQRLDFSRLRRPHRPTIQLLLDVLQRANLQLHSAGGDADRYQRIRVYLIEEFASCEDAERARARFQSALNRMLGAQRRGTRAAHHLVRRAKEYIDANYQRRISLSTVAEALHISANYLSRVFRRETGMTLTAYIQRVRLEYARLLLGEGSYTIAQIAYRVGYQNYRDFYRNFVKYEHASPRQIRRRMTGGRAEVS